MNHCQTSGTRGQYTPDMQPATAGPSQQGLSPAQAFGRKSCRCGGLRSACEMCVTRAKTVHGSSVVHFRGHRHPRDSADGSWGLDEVFGPSFVLWGSRPPPLAALQAVRCRKNCSRGIPAFRPANTLTWQPWCPRADSEQRCRLGRHGGGFLRKNLRALLQLPGVRF